MANQSPIYGIFRVKGGNANMLILLLLITPSFIFILASLLAIFAKEKRRPEIRSGENIYTLVPAHNEEKVIQFCLESLLRADNSNADCIYVVADNCADNTAKLAAKFGVQVLQRKDTANRGKGHALNYGFNHILDTRENIHGFVVIDADSIVSKNFYKIISKEIAQGTDWGQTYHSISNIDDGWRPMLLAHGYSLFNGVWQIGCEWIGAGANLRGNGMVFSFDAIKKYPWLENSLAEDLEYSWNVKCDGNRVRFIRSAEVSAIAPVLAGNSTSQRQRWEKGRNQLRRVFTPRILKSKLSWGHKLLLLGQLWALPLSLLGILTILFFMISLATQKYLYLSAVYFSALVFYMSSPFIVMHLPLRVLKAFAYAPYYAIWRIFVLVGKKPSEWIRTTRE